MPSVAKQALGLASGLICIDSVQGFAVPLQCHLKCEKVYCVPYMEVNVWLCNVTHLSNYVPMYIESNILPQPLW